MPVPSTLHNTYHRYNQSLSLTTLYWSTGVLDVETVYCMCRITVYHHQTFRSRSRVFEIIIEQRDFSSKNYSYVNPTFLIKKTTGIISRDMGHSPVKYKLSISISELWYQMHTCMHMQGTTCKIV